MPEDPIKGGLRPTPAPVAASPLEDGWNLFIFVAVVVERGDFEEESQVSKDRAGTCTLVTADEDWWSTSFGLFGVEVVVEMVVLCVDGDNDIADWVVEVAGCCCCCC